MLRTKYPMHAFVENDDHYNSLQPKITKFVGVGTEVREVVGPNTSHWTINGWRRLFSIGGKLLAWIDDQDVEEVKEEIDLTAHYTNNTRTLVVCPHCGGTF